MPQNNTPPPIIIFAVFGGVLFILGGAVSTMSPAARVVLIISAVAFAMLGIYATAMVRKSQKLAAEIRVLNAEIEGHRAADAGLRNRMAHTLRDPLAAIVTFADRMINEPELEMYERNAVLAEIRAGAREVEQVLADLAADNGQGPGKPHTHGVVLLHEEVRSVVSTFPTGISFETDVEEVRAWGDSAQVRQILRTIVNAARDRGTSTVAIKTETRNGKAVINISSRGEMLSPEGMAALTGNTEETDRRDDAYIALRSAREAASAMDGSVGIAEAFGRTQLIVELTLAPTDERVQEPTGVARRSQPGTSPRLTYTSASEFRPERPTASIRFS